MKLQLLLLSLSVFGADELAKARAEKASAYQENRRKRKAYVIMPLENGHYMTQEQKSRVEGFIEFQEAHNAAEGRFPPDILQMGKRRRIATLSPEEELVMLKWLQILPEHQSPEIYPEKDLNLGYEWKSTDPILTEDDLRTIQDYWANVPEDSKKALDFAITSLFQEVSVNKTLTDKEELKLRQYMGRETDVVLSTYIGGPLETQEATKLDIPKTQNENSDVTLEDLLRMILGAGRSKNGDERWDSEKRNRGPAGRIQSIHSNNIDRDLNLHTQGALKRAQELREGGQNLGGARAEFAGGSWLPPSKMDMNAGGASKITNIAHAVKIYQPQPVLAKFARAHDNAKKKSGPVRTQKDILARMEDSLNSKGLTEFSELLLEGIRKYLEAKKIQQDLGEFALQRLLMPFGFASHDVPADGECFYHALLTFISGQSGARDTQYLRTIAYDTVMSDETFKEIIKNSDRTYSDIKEGAWAGHEEIIALAKHFGLRIRIYQIDRDQNGMKTLSYNEFGEGEQIVNILHTSSEDPAMDNASSALNHFRPMFETKNRVIRW